MSNIRGVFKKRPNFLNSMPTSTESTLQLLSTPSVRFWQQTAICPILLWALVIELHPLNWACAQAVCWISDKVTMKEFEEQHVCVKFCSKLGKNFTETFQLLKLHSSQWKGKGSPRSKKLMDESVKDQGVVGCVFDWKGIVHHEFVPRGQMVNKQLYQEVLAHLRDAVLRKRPELWENQTWMLHHNNMPARASLLIRSDLAKHQISVLPNLPYSPDLTPADFFLFPKVKTTLKGHNFQTIEEIQENAIGELRAITESAF